MWILSLGLLLRLPGLVSRPLWYDEAFAVLFSATGIRKMIYGTLAAEGGVAADIHPLFFYSLLSGWGKLLGTSPLAVRSLAVILGLLLLLIALRLAQTLFGNRTGVAAGLLLAVSPFQVHYAQEVRMYGLLALLLTAATLAYWQAQRHRRSSDWVLFGILAGLSLHAHHLAALFLVPLGLTAVFRRRWADLWRTLAAALIAALLYLPWLLNLPSQLARIERAYWIPSPGPTELVRTLLVFVGGLPVPPAALPVVLTAALLLLSGGLLATWKAYRQQLPGWRRGVWMLYLSFAPVALMLLVSFWRPVYIDRAMLPAGVMFLLWSAWVLDGRRLTGPLLITCRLGLGLAMVMGLIGFYRYRGFPYAPYAELNSYLEQELDAGEVILHTSKLSALPAIYYAASLEQGYLADILLSGADTLAPATQEVLGLIAEPDIQTALGEARGGFLILFEREIAEFEDQFGNHPALAWLQGSSTLIDQRRFGELLVLEFAIDDRPR